MVKYVKKFYVRNVGWVAKWLAHSTFQGIIVGPKCRLGGSNEYLQSMFWAGIWKLSDFLSEIFIFWS